MRENENEERWSKKDERMRLRKKTVV